MARPSAAPRRPVLIREAARRGALLAAALVAAGVVAGCNAFPNPPPPRGFDGPTQVTVQPGEGLETIARRWNVPAEEVARMNGLQPPYSVPPGTVLTLPQPRLHVVREGDSLLTISQQYGVDVAALARANNIAEPYAIYVGETLRLPTGSGMAVAGLPPQGVSTGPSAGPRPIAGPGSTARGAPPSGAVESAPLDDLPARTSTPPAALATGPETSSAVAQPGASAPTGPVPGTLGTLPAARNPDGRASSPDASATPAGTTVAAAAAGLESLPRPPARSPVPSTRTAPAAPPSAPTPAAETAVASAPVASEAPAPGASTGSEAAPAAQQAAAPAATPEPPPATGPRFRWPVAGDVVSGFGPKGDGSRNDGINVAAPRGTPVVAAQNGVVAYVGDEIESFGNLVLLRHADGWVTAYAHVDRVLVAADERVSIGQTIATVGSTGNVATPQLHFEIRRGTEPVDPSVYLTAR